MAGLSGNKDLAYTFVKLVSAFETMQAAAVNCKHHMEIERGLKLPSLPALTAHVYTASVILTEVMVVSF